MSRPSQRVALSFRGIKSGRVVQMAGAPGGAPKKHFMLGLSCQQGPFCPELHPRPSPPWRRVGGQPRLEAGVPAHMDVNARVSPSGTSAKGASSMGPGSL